jgi:dihydroflavonol-4-reductase
MDTVFHLAAYVHVGRQNRRRHEEVNCRGTIALHRAAARMGVRRFVHVSSIAAVGAAVGGSEDGTPLDESAPWNLASFRNPYFDTKRSAEEYLIGEGGARRGGPDVIVVNPSILLGELKSVRSRAAAVAAGRRPPLRAVAEVPRRAGLLRLFLFRPPIAINLVDADDVARGLTLAAERGAPGERYLLAGHNLDWPAIARAVRPWIPIGPPVIPLPHSLLRGSARLATLIGRLTGKRTKWTVDRARLAALRWHYTSARAERELGWSRTPLERTVAKIFGAAGPGE